MDKQTLLNRFFRRGTPSSRSRFQALPGLLLALTAALMGVLGCNQERTTAPEPDGSWGVAPRIVATKLSESELSAARWVEVTAMRGANAVAYAGVPFDSHSVRLTIPDAGAVRLTLTGWDSSSRGTVLWSGSVDVETGTSDPVITLEKGPGLLPVPAPRVSQEGGTFHRPLRVALTADSADLEIHCTTDGGDPSASSPKCHDSVLIDHSLTLRAVALRKGRAPSPIVNNEYRIELDTVGAPRFSVDSGAHTEILQVAISSDTAGAIIHCTTDGSEPTASSPVCAGPVEVAASLVLKAIGLKSGLAPSRIASASYRITLPQLAIPEFSPEGGRFESNQQVRITAAAGAAIHYTTDGSTPGAGSPVYSDPVEIAGSTTLKAIAMRSGWASSDIASTRYTIVLPGSLAAPEISPIGGEFKTAQSVTMRADSGSVIRYTLDGSEPTQASAPYLGPVVVDRSLVVRALATRDGKSSSVSVASFTIRPDTVAAPRFSPEPGLVEEGQKVSITCDTAGATIRYTLDGSEPTSMSPVYSGDIVLQASTTLRAVAFKTGLERSELVSATYTLRVRGAVATPVFLPDGGSFDTAQSVTISCDTAGATIHYTTDGSVPTSTSPSYTGPFTVAASSTIRALAVKSGSPNSLVSEASFTITESGRVETPRFSPDGGSFDGPTVVAIFTNTDGAVIHFTDDGREPTSGSPIYSTPFVLDSSRTIRAIAFKDGLASSAIRTASYAIKPPDTVAIPVFGLQAGTYAGARRLGLSTPTTGASIHYTLDGSLPSETALLYSDSIVLDRSQTVKAIALRTGMIASRVVSAEYTISALDTVARPVFSPDSGTYSGGQQVSISTGTDLATIHYTIDGSLPTTLSAKYTVPLTVDTNTIVKAIAVRDGWAPSTLGVSAYRIRMTAPAPIISPDGGSFSTAQTVTLSTKLDGASIHYTLDGSDPSTASPKYTAPFSLSGSTLVRAIAVVDGMNASAITEAKFTIVEVGTTAAPSFSPAGGTFTGTKDVTISCTTTGANIYYTIDNTLPTAATGMVYSGPVSLKASTTIRAIAVASGMNASTVASASFTLQQTVAAPTFGLAAGSYTGTQSVTLASATTGATLYYTLDGTVPTTASKLYTGAIVIGSGTTTVKVIAIASGMLNSSVSSAVYTVTIPATVATPVFGTASGTYTTIQSVALTCATSGATIYYTTDGTAPTTSSSTYSGAISVGTTQTIRAMAAATGMTNSATTSATYTINLATVAAPTFSPAAGTLVGTQTIAITSATTGAPIYYTLDGTTPTTASTKYASALTVAATTTLKAIAVKTGMLASAVGTGTFTIRCEPPVFGLAAGSYIGSQSVSLATATAGATIYYTIDGTTPSATNGHKYTGAITVSYDQTLKAVAVKTGLTNSTVPSAAYNVSIFTKSGAPATVAFSPAGGTFTAAQSVLLTCSTTGATIYYTTDWSEPSELSKIYTPGKALSISANTTIKARAYNTTGASPVSAASYLFR